MLSKVVLFTLLATTVLANSDSDVRGNIAIGDTFGTHIVYHETHEKHSIPFIVRDENIKVDAKPGEIIKAVVVSDLKGGGKSYITEGGIGMKSVTIRLESHRGHGYKFLVEVYAI